MTEAELRRINRMLNQLSPKQNPSPVSVRSVPLKDLADDCRALIAEVRRTTRVRPRRSKT